MTKLVFSLVPLQDLRFAGEAMNHLQGACLMSSERGGMRIELARQRMGEGGVGLAPLGPLPNGCGAFVMPALPHQQAHLSHSPGMVTAGHPGLTP